MLVRFRPGAPSFAAARLRLAQPTSALSYAAAKLVRHSLLAKPDDVAIISYSIVKQPRGICVRIPAAGSARGLLDGAPQRIEGAGKAGCSPHPQPRTQKNAHERSRHRFAETIRPSLRNGLRLIPRSPRRPGFLATVACRSLPADLTPASGRQDHTALPSAMSSLVLRRHRVHRIPHPTFVTTAKRPS